jgi:hypothetical protein
MDNPKITKVISNKPAILNKSGLTIDIATSIEDNLSSELRPDVVHIVEFVREDIEQFTKQLSEKIEKEFV